MQTARIVLCGAALLAGQFTSLPAAAAGPLSIVAFGDSTTAPRPGAVKRVYADVLQDKLGSENAKVVNAGVPGNTTADALRRFDRDVAEHKPAIVVVQFGINDAAVDVWKDPPATQPRVSRQDYEKNLREIVKRVRALGARAILMTPNPNRWTPQMLKLYGQPPYRPGDPDGFNVLLRDYAETMRRVAREEKLPLVDVYKAYDERKEPAQSIDALLLDGVHPNDAGHQLVAELLAKEIAVLRSNR